MADSINRITPAVVTPDRVTVTRRERDNPGHGEEGREHQSPSSGSPPRSREDAHAAKDQQKGNRLDRSA